MSNQSIAIMAFGAKWRDRAATLLILSLIGLVFCGFDMLPVWSATQVETTAALLCDSYPPHALWRLLPCLSQREQKRALTLSLCLGAIGQRLREHVLETGVRSCAHNNSGCSCGRRHA